MKNKTDLLYDCLNQPTDTRLQRRAAACSRSPRDDKGSVTVQVKLFDPCVLQRNQQIFNAPLGSPVAPPPRCMWRSASLCLQRETRPGRLLSS